MFVLPPGAKHSPKTSAPAPHVAKSGVSAASAAGFNLGSHLAAMAANMSDEDKAKYPELVSVTNKSLSEVRPQSAASTLHDGHVQVQQALRLQNEAAEAVQKVKKTFQLSPH